MKAITLVAISLSILQGKSKAHIHEETHEHVCDTNLHNNGRCDWLENIKECGYDGGDCCKESCTVDIFKQASGLCNCSDSLELPNCGDWITRDCIDPRYSNEPTASVNYDITIHTGNAQSSQWR